MRTMRIQDLLAQQALQRDLASDPYGESSQISVDVPQNYMTSSSGMAYDFGPSQTSLGGGQGLDYASGPVEYMGQKGFRLAGDPFTVQLANGQRLRLGEDTAATQTRNDAQSKRIGSILANEQTQLENEQKRQQIQQGKNFAGGIPSLQKGEIWNPRLSRVESVPGSDRYIKQQEDFAKDQAAAETVSGKTGAAIAKVDEIFGQGGMENPSSGFQSNFGGYNAYLTQFFPGEASDTRKKIEGLKSDLKTAGLEMMRSGGSIGQMTEKEWPIVERMISNISPMLSEPEAAFQLAKVKTRMDEIAKTANRQFSDSWMNTQFADRVKEPSGGAPVPVRTKEEAMALPIGTRFILNGRSGKKVQ